METILARLCPASRLARQLLALCALALGSQVPGPATPPTAKPVAGASEPTTPQLPIPADTEVVTLPSGLRYCVLQAGRSPAEGGREPRGGDCVTIQYSAWLEQGGKLFDSTRLWGEPRRTWIGKELPGLNEVLSRMTRGARWKVTIPPALAYAGDGRPAGRSGVAVPSNATVIYELELVDVLFLPEFHAARPDATLATPGGLKYEILRPAQDESPPDRSRIWVIDYGLWTTGGILLDSAARQGAPFEIKLNRLDLYEDLRFMKDAFALLRPGGRLRYEIPPELCFGEVEHPGLPPNSTTIWEFELLRVIEPLPIPEFALPDESKCTKTKSGLLFEVLSEGTGRSPAPDGKALANYVIWMVNGQVFDASFEHGEPARLDLSDPGMIPGIRETLLMMREGATYRCIVPPELAYGERGWFPHIGPNAKLVVRLELVSAGP
jgi:FKBP-type peptidyl-prolyl cis-trans isomerase